MDFSQVQDNEQEIPLEYDTTGIDRQVQTQHKIDPDGENEKPKPTYFKQVANAFHQSRLVDLSISKHNQYMDELDNELKSIPNLSDEDKSQIISYHNMASRNTDMLRNQYENGDWNYDKESDTVNFNGIGRTFQLLGNIPLEDYKGYVKSRIYKNLDNKYLNDVAAKKTREKWLSYQKELDKDTFGSNFGSQLIGQTVAFLSDPVSLTTLGTEFGALKFIKPLTKLAMKGTAFERTVAEDYIMQASKITDTSGYGASAVIPKLAEKSTRKIAGFTKDELALGAGMETIIGATGEQIRQGESFDFKNQVLPEFTKEASNLQVGLAGGTAGVLTFVGASIGHAITTNSIEKFKTKGKEASDKIESLKKEPKQEGKSVEDLTKEKDNIDSILNDLQDCFVNSSQPVSSGKRFNQRKSKRTK